MINFTNKATSQSVGYDVGLRSHMLKVFNYMGTGLALSGFIAYLFMHVPAFQAVVLSLGWVWFIGLIVMAFLVLPRMMTMTENGAKLAFYGYATLLSVAISPIFLMYTGESIARTFFITASVFFGMSLYGYSTKKDLTSIGTFAAIGVFGVFIASLVNIFLHSPAIHFITSAVAVVASVGLTAYDTQKIKQIYYMVGNNAGALSKAAILGALQLYFDFVYMFINLLQFFGNRD
jgi:hypothetical protein